MKPEFDYWAPTTPRRHPRCQPHLRRARATGRLRGPVEGGRKPIPDIVARERIGAVAMGFDGMQWSIRPTMTST